MNQHFVMNEHQLKVEWKSNMELDKMKFTNYDEKKMEK